MTVQAKQNVPDLCAGVSIESRATMLTEAAPATPSLTCCRAKVDFREAQVPFYKKRAQVRLESAMVGESCLLEKAGSKRHTNYTLE